VYIESVRTLLVDGTISQKKTINGRVGFTELLDILPLVNEIIANKGKHRLVTPPRLLNAHPTSRPTATFRVTISTRLPEENSSPFAPIYLTLRDYECDVVYTVHVMNGCSIDWDLSKWDRLGTSRSTPPLPSSTGASDKPHGVPFYAVSSRNIVSMSTGRPVDLDVLSRHLKQRKQLGWGDIKEWNLSVGSISALPKFLFENRQITSIKVKKREPLPIHIGGFLCLDWSVLRRLGETHGLQHLELTIDFSKPCVKDIDARLKRIINSHNPFRPLFNLKTFTIRLTEYIHVEPAISTLPPFSQVAKLLVQLIGYDCQCTVEFDEEEADSEDVWNLAFRHSLRSQLIKEVRVRQEKEQRKKLEREDDDMIEALLQPREFDVSG
jgi:hypothetical protein